MHSIVTAKSTWKEGIDGRMLPGYCYKPAVQSQIRARMGNSI